MECFFRLASQNTIGCLPLPSNLDSIIDTAWSKAQNVEGYIGDREFRALCMLAAAAPTGGVNVEIGSFKGKSTIGVASIASAFNLGDVVSIDFERALTQAGLRDKVEAHRAPSREVAIGWNRPIRLLWIDGDHTYQGAKLDFDLFKPFLIDGAIVAIHDTLHEFEGPIRVFVEDMLRSDEFGPASLLHTIGWAQYRPRDGAHFSKQRQQLARKAARLIPLVANGRKVEGLTRMRFKLQCARIPHAVLTPAEFSALLTSTAT